jgi:hypothetical protein
VGDEFVPALVQASALEMNVDSLCWDGRGAAVVVESCVELAERVAEVSERRFTRVAVS